MRVTCNSVELFLEDLRSIDKYDLPVYADLLHNAIRVSTDKRALQEHVLEVSIRVSAVVNAPDEGQYLLEGGEICGKDYTDGKGETVGTDRLEHLWQIITEVAERAGYQIRPGIIEI